MILSSWGSAKVSLLLITSSSWCLSLAHSSIYSLTSTSISVSRVLRIFLSRAFLSSSPRYFSVWSSLILRFRFITKWVSPFKGPVLPAANLPYGMPKFCSCCWTKSSMTLSFRWSSASIMWIRVFSLMFSWLRLLVVIRYFITSS